MTSCRRKSRLRLRCVAELLQSGLAGLPAKASAPSILNPLMLCPQFGETPGVLSLPLSPAGFRRRSRPQRRVEIAELQGRPHIAG
jgi:hypothetical protein